MRSDSQAIPGASYLTAGKEIPASALLLLGASGTGKTMYCRQFLLDGLQAGERCIFASLLDERQLRDLFSTPGKSHDGIELVRIQAETLDMKKSEYLDIVSKQIEQAIAKTRTPSSMPVRLVVDSLSILLLHAGEQTTHAFVSKIVRASKEAEAMSIFSMATPRGGGNDISHLEPLFDGILEIKMEEPSLTRKVRLFSIKGMRHDPLWIPFAIAENGDLLFGEKATKAERTCSLCGKPISGTPVEGPDSEHIFDTQECLDTYRRLAGVYGSGVLLSEGLNYEVVTVNTFFIDIVGLSDPSLSVKRQVEKISVLSRFIASCDAFRNSKKDRMVLPTGDGMAIAFFQNPEIPLQLSMQLHTKLREFNRGRNNDEKIGVRIGISSGPVFLVNDLNNNQNVWGPGIILARRVMDIGDDRHILIAGSLADQLMALKDEYRETISFIGNYQIKHGQTIRVYSAHSIDYGNPERPKRMLSSL